MQVAGSFAGQAPVKDSAEQASAWVRYGPQESVRKATVWLQRKSRRYYRVSARRGYPNLLNEDRRKLVMLDAGYSMLGNSG